MYGLKGIFFVSSISLNLGHLQVKLKHFMITGSAKFLECESESLPSTFHQQ